MKTALVIGAAGFIGRHLCPLLMEAGYDVTNVDPVLPSSRSFRGWQREEGEFRDQACKENFDVVIHLGANIASIDERLNGGLVAYQDLDLDWQVCEWVCRYPPKECFIYPSSCAVDNPDDPYAWVKLTGERLCVALYSRGVPTVILRPFSGYGTDQRDIYPFPAILKRVLRGDDPVTVWGSGKQIRDWIHVDDLARAFMWAIEKAPRGPVPIEIGTGIGTPIDYLASLMAVMARPQKPPRIQADQTKPTSSIVRIASPRLAEIYGFEAKVTLTEGIRRAIDELSAPQKASSGAFPCFAS